jgi:hypothetical protein
MTSLSPVFEGEGRTSSPTGFELRQAIDSAGVDQLRADLGRLVVGPGALRIRCDRVTALDPVGAALLWLLCRNIHQTIGTRIRLTGMAEDLVLKLRSHPLQEFLSTGEEIFEDPFASQRESDR